MPSFIPPVKFFTSYCVLIPLYPTHSGTPNNLYNDKLLAKSMNYFARGKSRRKLLFTHITILPLCFWNSIIKNLFIAFTRLFAEPGLKSPQGEGKNRRTIKKPHIPHKNREKENKLMGKWREVRTWMLDWRAWASKDYTKYRPHQISSSCPFPVQSHTPCKRVRSCTRMQSSLQSPCPPAWFILLFNVKFSSCCMENTQLLTAAPSSL